MKKNILISLIFFLVLISCKTQNYKASLDNEIEKWKKGLLLSSEKKNECYDIAWDRYDPDITYENNNYTKVFKADFNGDKIIDAFVSMNAREVCIERRFQFDDYSVLIFSHEGKYYQDIKIIEKIENKILAQLSDMKIDTGNYKQNILIEIKSFDGARIIGDITIWTKEDKNCCPSYYGEFKYHAFFKIVELDIHKTE